MVVCRKIETYRFLTKGLRTAGRAVYDLGVAAENMTAEATEVGRCRGGCVTRISTDCSFFCVLERCMLSKYEADCVGYALNGGESVG